MTLVKIKMRQILSILSISVFLISCKNDFKKNSTVNENSLESKAVIDFDADFNNWLDRLDLNQDKVVDTSVERLFELWSFKDNLTESDSALYWYPSKDSSYYLITNFNSKTKNRIKTDYSNDIYLKFLDSNNEEVYNGLILLDSLKKQHSIDFYWYDSTTFYFIENPEGNRERNLTKLKMENDSIWTYKIEE